jgi:chaperonin GroES
MYTIKDKILVKVKEVENKTASGLIIPDSAKEKPHQGVILSVGKEVEDLKKDDIVLFNKYSGVEIEIEGEKYLVLKDTDILVVLD